MDDRSRPGLLNPAYLVLKPLAVAVEGEAKKLAVSGRPLRVLDVGCGDQPYRFMFGDPSCRYIGVDVLGAQHCDVFASGEGLPFGKATFDIVLVFQVIEHVAEPQQVLEEIHRVLIPGGHCLVSTHGAFLFHPSPCDYWRWTHQGLEQLFRRVGFDPIRIVPQGGTGSCLCYLSASYLSFLSYRLKWMTPARWIGVPLLNKLGPALDAMFPFLNHPNPFSLTANYLVRAHKTDGG